MYEEPLKNTYNCLLLKPVVSCMAVVLFYMPGPVTDLLLWPQEMLVTRCAQLL